MRLPLRYKRYLMTGQSTARTPTQPAATGARSRARLRARWLLLPALVWLATLPPRAAEAHLPPPVSLLFKITAEAVEVRLVTDFAVFEEWFGVPPGELAAGGVSEKARSPIETRMAEYLHIKINGRLATGRLEEAQTTEYEDHSRMWRFVDLRLRFPVSAPPQAVAFAWTNYESETGWVFSSIDAELDVYGETTYLVLREREPESIWHRPRETKAPAAIALPNPPKVPQLRLPVVSVGLLLLTIVAFFVLGFRGASLPKRGTILFAGVLLASSLSGMARVEIDWPPGAHVGRPLDEQARAIFERLLRGVYEAADGAGEDEIYDGLAKHVTGDLLPDLYSEIHQSLILHEEGGAVCKIQNVEILGAELLPPGEEGQAAFEMRARWQVEGKVGHWGHTHQRTNEYEADFTIVVDSGRWKVARMTILEQGRVDDGKKVR